MPPHALKSPDNKAKPTLRLDKEDKLKNLVHSTQGFTSEMKVDVRMTPNNRRIKYQNHIR